MLSALLVLVLGGCSSLKEYFPLPSPRVFPTLTPRPTRTPTVTRTSSPTVFVATQVTPAQLGTPLPSVGAVIQPANPQEIELVAELGKGLPKQIACSPDGKLLAVAASHALYLYDAVTLQPLADLPTGSLQQSLTFSPDSRLVASGDRHGLIQVWDSSSAALQQSFQSGSQPVLAIVFAADSQSLAASTWDGAIRLWRLDGPLLQHTYNARLRPVNSLSFSPDGEYLYGWAPFESLQVWRLSDGRALEDIFIGRDELGQLPISAAFTQDGSLFAANHGLRIRVFRTRNGTTLSLLRELQTQVQSVEISPNGETLASLEAGLIKIWDLQRGTLLAQIELQAEETLTPLMAFSPAGDALFTAGARLARWEITASAGEAQRKIEPQRALQMEYSTGTSSCAAFSNQQVFTCNLFGGVNAYHLADGTLVSLLPPARQVFSSAAISLPAGLAAFGSDAGIVALFDLQSGEQILTLNTARSAVRSLAFSADGGLLASGGDNGWVSLWQMPDGSLLNQLDTTNPLQELLFTPAGDDLLVRTRQGVSAWSIETQQMRLSFPGYSMALSGDGSLLAVSSAQDDSAVLNLYNLADGSPAGVLPQAGTRAALSPDHSLLALAGDDLTLWDTRSGTLLHTLPAVGLFGRLDFSPDGSLLLLTGWDGALRVWALPAAQ